MVYQKNEKNVRCLSSYDREQPFVPMGEIESRM